jgi:hypothetical protein
MTQNIVAIPQLITPQMAQAFLSNSMPNRSISERLVKRLADDMGKGRWRLTGEPIILSDKGRLMEGTHRCRAIVRSGVPVEIMVVRGVSEDDYDVINTGRSRNAADVLSIKQISYPKDHAAISRLVFNYINGHSVTNSPSVADQLEFASGQPYLAEITEKVVRARTRLSVAPMGAVLFLSNVANRRLDHRIDEFLDGLRTGENQSHGDPRLTLSRWHIGARRARGAFVPNQVVFIAYARAWNAFAQDQQLTKLTKFPDNPTSSNLPIHGYDPSFFRARKAPGQIVKDGRRLTEHAEPIPA